jgi:NADH dehydrogenase
LDNNQLETLPESIGITTVYNKIDKHGVEISENGSTRNIESKVVLWAAGVKGNFANSILTENKIEFDRKGRVVVQKNLTIPNYNDVYVIGDFASILDENNMPLPGTAPVAMQQGTYVAKHIKRKTETHFKYFNKGSLAVIGRNAAVADFGKFQISGFFAWILWVVVHIGYLIGFNNRIFVLIKWAWSYFIRKSTSRIIYRSTNQNFKN